MPDKLDLAYSAIGAILSDDDLKDLVKKSTGINLTDLVSDKDSPKKKIEKIIDFLKNRGNQRWLLTRVLFHVAKQADQQTIVNAFPETLIRLPKADLQVTSAVAFLRKVLDTPLSDIVKYKLLPSRNNFATIPQSIVALFAYKNLQECFHNLLLALNANRVLLDEDLAPDLKRVADQIDQAVAQAAPNDPASLARVRLPEGFELANLTQLAAALRATADTGSAADTLDKLQQLVRNNLSKINGEIFNGVQALSFDVLDELPSKLDKVLDLKAFDDLVFAVRDVMATVLAGALKSKMWQDAESRISSFGTPRPDAEQKIVDEWLSLRESIDWLAELEPDEGWADEARKYAVEIDDELAVKESLDDAVKSHFETYRDWFRGPFRKIDSTIRMDLKSLTEMGDPFTRISNDLVPTKKASTGLGT